MIARAGSGWQTTLADLSLILFMLMAAVVAQAGAAPQAAPALGEPIAVWRAGPDAPALPQWLAAQSADSRQQLTILAPQSSAGSAAALALARAAGRPARIVLEPGASGLPQATLAYDIAPAIWKRTP